AVVLGTLMMNPAAAANKKSSLSAQTRGQIEEVRPMVGGEDFSAFDLSAVTHKKLTDESGMVGRSSRDNYQRSDINWVTHYSREIPAVM
ncbi:MAG: hypothetical protein PVH25_11490, partial [Burkholderiales bacterium]